MRLVRYALVTAEGHLLSHRHEKTGAYYEPLFEFSEDAALWAKRHPGMLADGWRVGSISFDLVLRKPSAAPRG